MQALRDFQEFGIKPIVVDDFERNNGTRTIRTEDAVTGPGGEVYLSNGSSINAKDMAAHEAFHAGLKRSLDPARRFYELVQNADILDSNISNYLLHISDAYFEETGRRFDPASQSDMDTLMHELAAFVSGALNDGTAQAKFGSGFSDFDALQTQWSAMKEAMKHGTGQLPGRGAGADAGHVLVGRPEAQEGANAAQPADGAYLPRPEAGKPPMGRYLPRGSEQAEGWWDSVMQEDMLPRPASAAPGYWEAMEAEEARRYGDRGGPPAQAEVDALLDRAEQPEAAAAEPEAWTPMERGAVHGKAADYMGRAERNFRRTLGELLSVPRSADRAFLTPIVERLSEEYLRTGEVRPETLEHLFETAYQQGIVVDDAFYNEYKDVKDLLRTQAVRLDAADRADIPDFEAWRRQNMGRIRVAQDGVPVDVQYQALRERAPELFPEGLDHPADQLMRMAEVSESIRRVEQELSAYYGDRAEEFRGYAREQFGRAVDSLLPELARVKRYSEERAREEQAQKEALEFAATAMGEAAVKTVNRMWTAAKSTRKQVERAVSRNLLTRAEERQVDECCGTGPGLERPSPPVCGRYMRPSGPSRRPWAPSRSTTKTGRQGSDGKQSAICRALRTGRTSGADSCTASRRWSGTSGTSCRTGRRRTA